jgi:hypothetical protein
MSKFRAMWGFPHLRAIGDIVVTKKVCQSSGCTHGFVRYVRYLPHFKPEHYHYSIANYSVMERRRNTQRNHLLYQLIWRKPF